jgi:hypothetical protein
VAAPVPAPFDATQHGKLEIIYWLPPVSSLGSVGLIHSPKLGPRTQPWADRLDHRLATMQTQILHHTCDKRSAPRMDYLGSFRQP